MNLTVVGLGYIGLPTSIMFANHGVDVVGVDVNPSVIEKLNSGSIHIEEPGLQEAYMNALDKGKFKASLEPEKADAFIVAVPTPNKNDEYKSFGNKYLMQALENILPVLEKGNTVIVESTLAPRVMDDEVKPFFEEHGYTIGEDLYLVHCPERVLPGKILEELIYNNRIIGGMTKECVEAGKKVYGVFVKGEMIETDATPSIFSSSSEILFSSSSVVFGIAFSNIMFTLNVFTFAL